MVALASNPNTQKTEVSVGYKEGGDRGKEGLQGTHSFTQMTQP